MNVRNTLIATSIAAPLTGSAQSPPIEVSDLMIMFIGIVSSRVTPMPRAPATKPIVIVSALNTR